MTTKEQLIKRLTEEIESRQSLLQKLAAVDFGDLDVTPCIVGGNQVDFDNLPHYKVISVIKAIGDKWNKTPADNGAIHYQTEKDGVKYRCWSGEPPPNCKIVEVLETIPAQPERVVTRRKLVCQ